MAGQHKTIDRPGGGGDRTVRYKSRNLGPLKKNLLLTALFVFEGNLAFHISLEYLIILLNLILKFINFLDIWINGIGFLRVLLSDSTRKCTTKGALEKASYLAFLSVTTDAVFSPVSLI